MAATTTILSVATLIVSFFISTLLFIGLSPLKMNVNKEYVEEVITFIINTTLLIWTGKVLFNLSLFLNDPIAVLAYPSGSRDLYFGVFIASLILLYYSKRKDLQLHIFVYTLVGITLFASLSYTFIDLIWHENSFTFPYLIVLVLSAVGYTISTNLLSLNQVSALTITFWGVGQLYLVFTLPFITLFSYMVSPWFVGFILIIGIFIILKQSRKLVSHD
ncbi:hypothetical protein [Halalkalibacillus halophilus]|uniref:hypothetical protein n=1 Tax=Halalkalibacillus halophilus TaxID=392827 RepID=UPI00041CE6B1|nr:hypothetical protein [Halalkalibacillus halophilus]